MELAVKKLRTAEMSHLKVALLEVIANSLYYNPLLALRVLDSQGITTEIFSVWFKLLNTDFKRRHEIKLTILAFSAIFHIPLSQWPPPLRSQTKILVTALMELCKKYTKIQMEEPQHSDLSDSSDSDEEDAEDDDDIDNDETLPLTTDEYNKIKSDIPDYKNKIYEDDEDVAPDMLSGAIMHKLAELYEDASSDSIVEDQEFSSLIDDIDELLFFLEAFRVFSHGEPVVYQQLLQTFTPEEQLKLQELGEEANIRQANMSHTGQNSMKGN